MNMNAVSAVKYSALHKARDCRTYFSNSNAKSLSKAFLLPMVNQGHIIPNVGANVVPYHKKDVVVNVGFAVSVIEGFSVSCKWVGRLHNYFPHRLNHHFYISVPWVNATDVCNKLMGLEVIFVVQSTLVCIYPLFGCFS